MASWLLGKIGRYNELADKDLRQYVEEAVDELLKAYSAEELYRMKYHVRDRLKQNIVSRSVVTGLLTTVYRYLVLDLRA
jgi:hypothetical protein